LKKVILIGIDGACWSVLNKFIEFLPNIKSLKENGSFAEHKGVMPPLTIPAWNCINTGKNPAKLGIYDFMEKISKIIEVMKRRGEVFRYLYGKYDFDFSYIVYTALDRVSHKYWMKEEMLDVLKRLDIEVGEILNLPPDDKIIIIVSDHGFTSLKRIFYLNQWFYENNYLFLEDVKRIEKSKNFNKIYYILKKFGLIKFIKKILPNKEVKDLSKTIRGVAFSKCKVDWSKTKAFSYMKIGEIFLNVKDREPEGIIEPDEYDMIRDEIIEKLHNIGVESLKREEIYEGRYLKDAPDIYVLIGDEVSETRDMLGSHKIFEESSSGSIHHRKGLFLISGSNIKRNFKLDDIEIYDIFPTILKIFGINCDKNIDGRILEEVFL